MLGLSLRVRAGAQGKSHCLGLALRVKVIA